MIDESTAPGLTIEGRNVAVAVGLASVPPSCKFVNVGAAGPPEKKEPILESGPFFIEPSGEVFVAVTSNEYAVPGTIG